MTRTGQCGVTMKQDTEHLDLLSTFHYVVAAVAALCACFPFLHLFTGIAMLSGTFDTPAASQDFPNHLFGLFFVVFAAAVILLGWAFAICVFLAGRYLRERTHYTYCLVIAGVACMFMPVGTVLGVLTIVVLQRPTVKQIFGLPEATADPT